VALASFVCWTLASLPGGAVLVSSAQVAAELHPIAMIAPKMNRFIAASHP
jgi:hypothetical protein